MILNALGEDPEREGLANTPKRYVKWLFEQCTRQPFEFTMFENEGHDQMIVQRDIPFYSLCEHHLAPFFGVAHVAYIPHHKIVGLSKLTRAVQYHAAGLQNQERITTNVAEMLCERLDPRGVGVVVNARHLCMEMRGAKAHGVHTSTTALHGYMKSDPQARSEFLSAIQ